MKWLRGSVYLMLATIGCSCDKGYEVRVTNYYIEPMDSVVIGNNIVVFENIPMESTTSFNPIAKGKYSITCIAKTKKRVYGSIEIPGSESGVRTIQVDAISQISILEE